MRTRIALIEIEPFDYATSDLFYYWLDFINLKRQTTRAEGTIKRYNNLIVNIGKFKERYKGSYAVVCFSSLNQKFFNDLIYYMVKEHEYFRSSVDSPITVVLPEIGLSNETAIKRIADLVEYLGYCKRRKSVNVDMEEVKEFAKIAKFKFRVAKQSDSKKWELTLTTEELQFIINLNHFEPNYYNSLNAMQRRYLDIFIFMCLQGTSPIDTKKIKETDVMRGKLIGERSKTGTDFKVELDPISEQILINNKYNLSFVEQKFNDAIKKMLVTIFELYRPYFEEKYDEAYELIYTQRKSKGDDDFLLIQQKGLFAECMTGRRSFITNINEETDELGMRENMRKTGHSRIQTHLGYQKDRQTGKTTKKRSLFGVFKVQLDEEVSH
jgi:hypothetical protein